MEPLKIRLSLFPSEEVSPLRGAEIPGSFFAALLAGLQKCPPRKLSPDETPKHTADRTEDMARTTAGVLFAHGKLPLNDYYARSVPDINIALASYGSNLRLVEGAPPNGHYFLIRVT
jgi:hypothetical protein